VNEIQKKLPADPGALVLGIISIVIILTGCCCGILSIPVLVMGIIGWVWASNSKKTYRENPENYSPRSYSNVNTGLVMNMICTIIVGVLLTLGLILEGFSLFNPETYFERWENNEFNREMNDDDSLNGTDEEIDTWEYNEESTDTIDYNEEIIEMEAEEQDSLNY